MKKVLFTTILLIIFVGVIEVTSVVIWKMKPDTIKNNIKALCNPDFASPGKIPNTFWHHEYNPNHPAYRGIINNKGAKGKDFRMPKPMGELRIICIGDSTVEGTGVDPDQTFPYFLEEMLKGGIKYFPNYKSVKVINAGIGSHNSAFNLAYLEFRLIHYEPDVVLIKSSYNDYLPYCVPGMQLDYTHVFPKPFYLERSSNPYWLIARYSYFLRLLGHFIFNEEAVNPNKNFSGHITKEQLQKVDFSPNENKFYIYAENIRSMILLCRGRNIKVFVLDLPTSPDPNHYGRNKSFGKRFRNLIGRLESELKRVTFEEEVTFIITGPLDKNKFWDHCHNTASGNREIAIRIYDVLLENK